MKHWLRHALVIFGLSGSIVACVTPPVVPPEVIIPSTTKVLSPASQTALETVQPNSLTFAGAQTIATGDVVVSAPTVSAPNGFLRKVTGVKTENGKTILETAPATLREAIQKGKLQASRDLTNADIESSSLTSGVQIVTQAAPANPTFKFDKVLFDKDSNPDTKEDQVVLKGYVDFKLTTRFDWDIDIFPPDFDFLAEAKFTQQSGLSLKGKVAYSFNKSLEIGTIRFRPITFSIGPIPIVIRPIIKLTIGVRGSATGEVDVEVTQVMVITAGAKYDEEWTNLSGFTKDFSIDSSTVKAALNTEAFANVTLELLLYESVGLFIRPEIFLALDAQIPRKPFFKLEAGIGIDIGIKIDKWGLDKSYDTRIFETRYPIYASPNSPPSITDFTVFDISNLNRNTFFSSNATDLEDGTALTYTWTSSLAADGAIAATRETSKVFATVGTRNITLTVRDSNGETSTRSKTINVVNTAPELNLSEPSSASVIYQTLSYGFSANARDINEPNDALACSNITWTSSNTTDPFPQTGCEISKVFSSAGTRTLTITATDPQGLSNSQTVVVNVLPTPANPPPNPVNISSPTATTVVPNNGFVTLAGSATDPAGDPVTLSWLAAFSNSTATNFGSDVALTPNINGQVNLTAALGLNCLNGYNGSIRITLVAKDPQLNEGRKSVIIRNVICVP